MYRLSAAVLLFCMDLSPAYGVYYPEIAVYVDSLNLRAEPTTSAEVVKTLPYGAKLSPTGAEEEWDNYRWLEVKSGTLTGWVASRYVIGADASDAFAKAIDLAREGEAAPMVGEIKRAHAGFDEWSEYELSGVLVSPDGRKVLLRTNDRVLVFVGGKGVDNLCTTWSGGGLCEWTVDSRYLAYSVVPEGSSPIVIYDTDACEVQYVVAGAARFELADGYLVYLGYDYRDPQPGFERIAEYGKDLDVLRAVDIARAIETPVLEPDPATVRSLGNYAYEVMLAPAEPVPGPVKDSGLYREYGREYVLLG